MIKTKKFLLTLLFTLFCVCVFALVGCSSTQGKQGENGKDGTDGKSAYEIWIDNGHTGTETDFLNWLKGDNGTDGSQGSTGNTGAQGPQGEKGDTGDKGQDGTNGKDGINGLSAYEIYLKYNPDYTGSEEQWINGLVNNQLYRFTVTFKSEVHEDITKTVFYGLTLFDIPNVPEKEGQESAVWDRTDFTNITTDLTVNAVYTMKQFTVTFHNEFTDDQDIVKTVTYGETLTDIPTVTAKQYNDGYWDIQDFSNIKSNIITNAVYETQGLEYTLIDNTKYRVSSFGTMNTETTELFIRSYYNGKPVTEISERALSPNTYANGYRTSNIEFVFIPDSVTKIGEYAFENNKKLCSIRFSHNITELPFGCFYGCNFTSVSIPENITILKYRAFDEIKLETIILTSKTKTVDITYFSENSNLTLYYKGTKSELFQLTFDKNGTPVEVALTYIKAVYYYSETQPTDNGLYWHYDTDGITPVIWAKNN